MKMLETNRIAKKIIAVLLVIATILPYFPMSVFAQNTENSGNNETVQFTANWNSEQQTETGTTNDSFYLKYGFTLNGVSTGFQNVNLLIKTDTVEGANDVVTIQGTTGATAQSSEGKGMAVLNFGNVNQGIAISGDIGVLFKNTNIELTRKVTLILTGTYIDPNDGTTKNINEIRELTALVTPATITTPYLANINWQQEYTHGMYNDILPSVLPNRTTLYGTYGQNIGYYTNNIKVTYPIKIESYEKTQKLELKIRLNRYDIDDNQENINKMSQGYSINWGGLNTDLGEPVQTTDPQDGSIIYTFTKGADTNYNSNTAFSLDKTYNIVVQYETPTTDPTTQTNPDYRTNMSFIAELNTIGYEVKNVYGQPETTEKKTTTKNISDERGLNLYSYTPGENAWLSVNALTSEISNSDITRSEITNDIIQSLKNNETVTVDANIGINFINGEKSNNENGLINITSPVLYYYSDSGVYQGITLSADQMKLKTLTKPEGNEYDSYFVDEQNETGFDNTYTPVNNINNFSIKLKDIVSDYKNYSTYGLRYELNLSQSGLTQTEIQNINYLKINFTTSGSSWINGKGSFDLNKKIETEINEYSYFELELTDSYDTTSEMLNREEEKTLKLKMYKNNNKIKDGVYNRNYVVNQNPIFYVRFPSSDTKFIYDIDPDDIQISDSSNLQIDVDNLDYISKNGDDFLVIPCIGTYDSRITNEVDISITFNRKLKDPSSGIYFMYGYMITDNENYYSKVTNYDGLTKVNGEEPDKLCYESKRFDVVGINKLEATTEIRKGEYKYKPNPSDGINNDNSEKEMPVVVGTSDKLIYYSRITSENERINNVTILSRIPVANNTEINDFSKNLIEDGFSFAENSNFYTTHAGKLKGYVAGSAVSQIDLQDLQNIEIVCIDNDKFGTETTLDPSKYTIYYTTEANATFDSASFVQYQEGDDLSSAKNIKVVITDPNVILNSGESYALKYEMTMPDQQGMVGSQTSVRYTKVSDGTTNILTSPAAYVMNGDTASTINIQKTFENYPAGVAPEDYGVSSLAGIKFKLEYYNETTKQREFLKDGDNHDIEAITDETGKATFDEIPAGRYFLYEDTEFSQYSGIGRVNIINVEEAQTVEYTAVNRLKRGDIIINKTWEGSNETQGKVTFIVSRENAENEEFTFTQKTVETDEDDKAYIINVPYGTYQITETTGQTSWVPENAFEEIVLDNSEVTSEFKNIPAKATLQIEKTVPSGETVDGLTFKIVGVSSIKKQESLTFNPNQEITVKIGDTYPSNVTVEKTENDTKAVITIDDLYLGYYTVEEIDIPLIEGTQVAKYTPVGGSAILDENGGNTLIRLQNNYKTGRIIINKTAKLKDGINYYNIDDLSKFQVRITGTSYYNQNVDRLLTLDEDGHAETNVEIGEYTITEVPVDGYTTYYGLDSTASTTPPVVTISENNAQITQNIYNEHTGVGYVRIEKTLEGVTDPNEVVAKGIKFAVIGRNVANQTIGQDIGNNLKGEIIEINSIDPQKNVAYGISGPISVGGEYELQEIESTVPEYYESYEPTLIEIKTENTQSDPLIKNIDNLKSRGNLEIITTTDPQGGPLTGITYKVTPVVINSDATYTPDNENAQTIEGSNDTYDTSFARLENIYAGFYLVEQVTVPDGWEIDVKQIVEVPSNNTGYANFEITQKKQLKSNKLTIRKVIYDENDEIAGQEYIEKCKLNENESFEVKITNVNTHKEYYVFTSVNEPGVITGLDAGTYTIEETFKPKYTNIGYFEEELVTPSISGELIMPQFSKQQLQNNTFTIQENGTNIEDVTLVIDNKIDTSFGFGGQDSKDNLSKIEVEQDETNIVTKTVIYVTDEQNKAISGAKFQLINTENNQAIILNNLGEEFEINDKKLIIKGLPVGIYTLECTQYPEGYLKPDDKQVVVYEDATQVVRVEIQKNIPRGTITLSTIAMKNNGEPRYVTSSSYNVVDKSTGELVKFVKTPAGNYKKSNTSDASETITLKSAPVELQGIEVGDYEVGIVGVKKGYGIGKDDIEYVTVEENENENIVTTVVNKTIDQIDVGGGSTSYLDVNGDLYIIGNFGTTEYDRYEQFEKINFPENVKIAKYSQSRFNLVAIDTQGRVWYVGQTEGGSDYDGTLNGIDNFDGNIYFENNGNLNIMKCLTDEGPLAKQYEDGARFTDVQKFDDEVILLDNQGRVWGLGSEYLTEGTQFLRDNNIKINKLVSNKPENYYTPTYGVIDNYGKLWVWGNNNLIVNDNDWSVPECISDTTDLRNVSIKDAAFSSEVALALDETGNVWIWGQNTYIQETVQGGTSENPTKLSSANFNGRKIVKVACSSDVAIVVDETGEVWTWGQQEYGELGNGYPMGNQSIPTPSNISEYSDLKNTEITDVVISSESSNYDIHVVAIDKENKMWAWGGKNYYGESGLSQDPYVYKPQRMYTSYNEHFEYNLKFTKVYGIDTNNHYAIDTKGRLWVWGYNSNYELGLPKQNIEVPTLVDIPGNPVIKKVSVTYGSAIILSEDGRVFVCGNNIYPGDGLGGNLYRVGLTEITNNFTSRIVDVVVTYGSNPSYIALDSNGKVWTWGNSYGPIGRTTNTLYISEPLASNIVKIEAGNYNDCGFAIDQSGDLIKWKGTSTYTDLSLGNDNGKAVDVVEQFILDSNGHVWWYDDYNNNLKPITKSSLNILNSNYSDPDYKIVEMFRSGDNGEVVLKDSNGDLWKQYNYSDSATKIDTGIKNPISVSCDLLVDKNGQIWSYDNDTVTNIMATTRTKNPAYGIKIDHIINNQLYAGKDNKIYDRMTFQEVTDASVQWSDVYNGETAENEEILYLDENNKLWYNGNCINEQGSTLYGIEIAKTYVMKNGSNRTLFVITQSGDVYSWGYNYYGGCGIKTPSNSNITSPKQITTLTGITSISELSIGNYCAKDDNGNVWVWGRNSSGVLGNGNSSIISAPYKINVGKKIIDIILPSGGIWVLCEDGSVYQVRSKTLQYQYTCEGAELFYGSDYIIGNNKLWADRVYVNNYIYGKLLSSDFTPKFPNSGVLVDIQGNMYYTYEGELTQNDCAQVIALDNSNGIYTIDGKYYTYTSDTGTDISKIIISLYGELNEENIIKYSKLDKTKNDWVLINGVLWWLYNYNVNGYYSAQSLPNSPLKDKIVVEYDGINAIDSQGDVYQCDYNSIKCLTRDEYNVTEGTLKANHNIINTVVENNLYGVKFKDVINDRFAIDINDNVWYFPLGGQAINLSETEKGTLNTLYGIKRIINNNYIVTANDEVWYVGGQTPQYVMKAMKENYTIILENYNTVGYEFCVALDPDGKLWSVGKNSIGILGNGSTTTNGELVCINDIEGTELYNLELNDPEFKIVKSSKCGNNLIFAIDSLGKVWRIGGGSLRPVCCTDETDNNNIDLHDSYYNDEIGIVDMEYDSPTMKFKDTSGQIWILDSSKFKRLDKQCLDIPENTKVIKITKKEEAVLTDDGKVYIYYTPEYTDQNSVTYSAGQKKYKLVEELSNVSELYCTNRKQVTPQSGSNYEYTAIIIAVCEDGIYRIKNEYDKNGTYQNDSVDKVSEIEINKTVTLGGNYYFLDSDGNLWLSGQINGVLSTTGGTSNIAEFECITTNNNSPLYNKNIKDIEVIGSCCIVTDENDDLYVWSSSSTGVEGLNPTLFNKDDAVQTLYGQVNNETRKQLYNEPTNICKNGKYYKLSQTGLTEVQKEYAAKKYNSGIGIITEIVGEWEVKNDVGEIYQIRPTGDNTYSVIENPDLTPFSTATPDEPIQIDDVNIVKQVKHKALDNKGNLYVWGENYTGIDKEITGYLNLTNEQYSTEPIYGEGNGWTVIRVSE